MNKPVLLAEDDAAIVQVVTEILELEGISIVHADTEQEVLKKAVEISPCAIFLDISLSGSDGRKIAKKLRVDEKTKNLPIVIMSADAHITAIAQEVGADDVLVKPFDIESLLGKVKQFIDK